MTTWIDEALAAKKASDAQHRSALLIRDTKQATLYSEGLSAFKQLSETVASQVEGLNSKTVNYQDRLSAPERIGERRFQVKRAYDPSFTLTVDFSERSSAIEYTIIRPSAIDHRLYKQSGQFLPYLQNNAGVSLTDNGRVVTVLDIAQMLLLPALEGYAQPL